MQNSWETPILKNICVWLLLNWLYKMVVWNFVSGQSLSKPSWLSNITKIPVAFKPDFKSNLLHMRSLYLTLTLSFEPRFFMFIINGNYTKSKRLQPWTRCYVFGRGISTVDFKILMDILPLGVALEPSKFIISFLTRYS